ncbi:MAG: hypothetical protein ACRESJ_10920 [Pseudomonas sp.]|uniref:hypothetical protein n=1 Tax=Pseudomonas sp. TaxID=306 RepID=UPI003D6EAA63
MCTLTQFPHPQTPSPGTPAIGCPVTLQPLEHSLPEPTPLRFQVVLAGNAFFHIKEISTGHVRGFRGNHNEACALARSFESHI